MPDLTIAIDVNLAAAMTVPEQNRWYASDDVVVVDEAKMIQFDEVDVAIVTDPRAAVGEKLFGNAADMRKKQRPAQIVAIAPPSE